MLSQAMANAADVSPLDRIDRAIARIQAASDARAHAARAIADRHAILRDRIAEAVATLDEVIAHGGADD